MLSDVINEGKRPFSRTLIFDLSIPTIISLLSGAIISSFVSSILLQFLFDLPLVGYKIYGSSFHNHYIQYWFRLLIFSSPLFLLWTTLSWSSIRIPGPGRPVFLWWQSLGHSRVKKEKTYEKFPPDFDYDNDDVKKLRKEIVKKDNTIRAIGYIKRFQIDIEKDKSDGLEVESGNHFVPIELGMKARFQHIQCVGTTGSGKTASIMAPLLRSDCASSNIGCVIINPKTDMYLMKCMADGPIKRINRNPDDKMPNAIISLAQNRVEYSLSYDPLLYGDADQLTKKIIYSGEINEPYYRSVQETWLMSFFRVIKTEKMLDKRIMLRHLHRFLVNPVSVMDLASYCENDRNVERLEELSKKKANDLSGIAAHISLLVEDESLSNIFDNSGGRFLDVVSTLRNGGNIYLDLDVQKKGPQSRALGRMIMRELQDLSSLRNQGVESMEKPIFVYLDEFASFAYDEIINFIDKCRGAKMGLFLAHQSEANLIKQNLSRSFKGEILDNCNTKIFLDIKSETAPLAVREFGQQMAIDETIIQGENLDVNSDKLAKRESINRSKRQVLKNKVEVGDLSFAKGRGAAIIYKDDGNKIPGYCSFGYIKDSHLCSDEELNSFLERSYLQNPTRPLNGSLIDNDIDHGLTMENHDNSPSPVAAEKPVEISQHIEEHSVPQEHESEKTDEIEEEPKLDGNEIVASSETKHDVIEQERNIEEAESAKGQSEAKAEKSKDEEESRVREDLNISQKFISDNQAQTIEEDDWNNNPEW